jgi:hypothetical protein
MQTETQELEEHNRRTSRTQGYNLMSVRDAGAAKLSNGVLVRWHVPKPEDYHQYHYVPEGKIVIGGKLFDVEELRSFLRWA